MVRKVGYFLLVTVTRVPIIGCLLVINRISEFIWVRSDEALEFFNTILPGYERKKLNKE